MRLYTAVVVDDEKWSIIDLLNSVEWDAHGFQVVAYFERPFEALERIVAEPPDVVFTDIRMPRMDGIKLMQETRAAGIDCEFVAISAFADFNSARKAIAVGVADYCLKPVNPEALSALLGKLKAKIDEKIGPVSDSSNVLALPANFGRIVAYIKEHFKEELGLEELAERFSLNKNYLCGLFKKHLDTTFSRYVAALRTESAKEYLSKSSVSLEEISRKVGYSDYFYFCKVFKKVEGLSPGRYRRLRREELKRTGNP